MPLVIPSLSWTGLDYILAPETQNLIVNYAVTSAVEHPWTTVRLPLHWQLPHPAH
ncbi:hypothetical protein EX30DRAFT_344799 [Ascodesmis nigricans]|uniref:Uncharacterized protein n=1 Tax=Ascodesmis nigricans TaxID=341454 RepID=A0A4V6RHA4_9PEZI|nr:hypothetical protein EX30DRAFT_344799 [Ascodesmis nigricans]